MRFFIPIFCIILLPEFVAAQQKWKSKMVPEAGFLIGSFEQAADFRFQYMVAKEGWQLGVGCGIDFYRFRSLPLYAQGRKYFGSKKQNPFALLSAGYNIATPTQKEKDNQSGGGWWNPTPASFEGGIYAEAGGGLAFRLKQGSSLGISLSYVLKSISVNYPAGNGTGLPEPGEMQDKYTYIMNRLAIRLGYSF